MDILSNSLENQNIIIICLLCATFRVFLECINFNFEALPLTKRLSKVSVDGKSFHKTGLYLSVGYIVLFAPSVLLT